MSSSTTTTSSSSFTSSSSSFSSSSSSSSSSSNSASLLLLLDGVLSQDEFRVNEALRELAHLVTKIKSSSPSSSLSPSSNSSPSSPSPPSSSPLLTNMLAAIGASTVSQLWLPSTSPSSSPSPLYLLLQEVLKVVPELSAQASAHDRSLPLHFAASLGDVSVARLLLEKFPLAASTPNAKGKVPLHYAAREGRLEMVRFLLEQNRETAQIVSKKYKLALHFAAGDGHDDVCALLLQAYPQGASLPSAKGKVALHFCARWGHVAIARQLLQVFPQGVYARDWEGSVPLHDAARQGQVTMSELLLQHYPQAAQITNLRGELPLFPAVRSGQVDLVQLLLQVWPEGGKHVLQSVSVHDSVEEWSWEMMELLLRGAVGVGASTTGSVEEDNGKGENSSASSCFVAEQDDKVATPVASAPAAASERPEQLFVSGSSSIVILPDSDVVATHSEDQEDVSVADGEEEEGEEDDDVAIMFQTMSDSSSSLFSIGTVDTDTTGTGTMDSNSIAATGRSYSPILETNNKKNRIKRSKKRSRDTAISPLDGSRTSSNKRPQYADHSSRISSGTTGPASYHRLRRFIPLHAALQCRASLPVVQHILECRPQDVHVLDQFGRTPLHWAVVNYPTTVNNNSDDENDDCAQNSKHNNDDVVALIRRLVTPESVRVRDFKSNQLPLHLALQHQVSLPVLDCLLEAHPTSGVEPCHDEKMVGAFLGPRSGEEDGGEQPRQQNASSLPVVHNTTSHLNFNPFHMACHYDCDVSVIYRLLRVDPSVLEPTR